AARMDSGGTLSTIIKGRPCDGPPDPCAPQQLSGDGPLFGMSRRSPPRGQTTRPEILALRPRIFLENSVMRIISVLGIGLGGLVVIGVVTAFGFDTRPQFGGTIASVVDDKGNLHVPSDYRTAYQALGAWAVAKDDGPGSKQLHVVYASPGTIDAYRKDGHFPDGTVLVKEGFNTTTKDITTGTVSTA